jgi:hypothetical protein
VLSLVLWINPALLSCTLANQKETGPMIDISQQPQQPKKRSGLRWYQQILLFIMTLLGLACIGLVTLLYFGYSIPGVKVPPYLSFLLPPPTATLTPYYTPTITPTFTNTPVTTPTNTRTVVPTLTLIPSRTKAPTWTLLPIFITPTITPTVSGTPPTDTPTP